VRVLLVGGSGQLGSEILGRWSGDAIAAPAHDRLDLEDSAALEREIAAAGAELVVNCAAFHNVDVCESQPDRAFAVNALAVDRAAAICERLGAAFLTVSTDYVFDGAACAPYTEADCPHPLSAYGASKLAGEHLVLRRSMRAYVVRTCGVYGVRTSQSKGTFIDRIVTQARGGDVPRVVDDVIAAPTYAGHLANALRELVRTSEYGLYHACNVGPVSWYDFASAALELAGVPGRVEAISASQWKAPARRPAYSALANARFAALGIVMPGWREGIAAYLHDA
jgi:dTDP-4-dehydrorhamnose reductase